jgi:cytochrome d ubiquinol oxidase subunit I
MFDDPLLLARLQFSLTAATHYLFVAFTLGLAPFILFGQLGAVLRRDPARLRAVRFWGGLYVVNYGMGVLSGLVMELQLAVNWSGLGEAFGYAFGAPLAVETMVAFFLESTFLGLWIFGWDRMNRWAHLACFAVVAATAYASAYWVLVANGFLRSPVGFEMRGGTAVVTDATALLANPAAVLAFAHVVAGTLMVGAVVVAAVSAYHLARGADPDRMFIRALRASGLVLALALVPTAATGGVQFGAAADAPPTSGLTLTAAEIAAVEDAYDGGAAAAIGAAGELVMVLSWALMSLLALVLLLAWVPKAPGPLRWALWPVVFTPVLPYAASVGGWVYRETERQPWAVVHHLTTADAMTDLGPVAAGVSFSLFTAAFAVLAGTTWWLLVRYARRGPDGGPLVPAPQPEADARPPAVPVA